MTTVLIMIVIFGAAGYLIFRAARYLGWLRDDDDLDGDDDPSMPSPPNDPRPPPRER